MCFPLCFSSIVLRAVSLVVRAPLEDAGMMEQQTEGQKELCVVNMAQIMAAAGNYLVSLVSASYLN